MLIDMFQNKARLPIQNNYSLAIVAKHAPSLLSFYNKPSNCFLVLGFSQSVTCTVPVLGSLIVISLKKFQYSKGLAWAYPSHDG